MGLFSFKPKVRTFKESNRKFPLFTNKDALPDNADIRFYFYHYCQKGCFEANENADKNQIRLAIMEKICELIDEGKIDPNANYAILARKTIKPTEEDKVQIKKEEEETYSKYFNEYLDNLKSSFQDVVYSYYKFQKLLEGENYFNILKRNPYISYLNEHYEQIVQVLFEQINIEKEGNTENYIGYVLLKDMTYLIHQGYFKSNANKEKIMDEGIRVQIPYCIFAGDENNENMDLLVYSKLWGKINSLQNLRDRLIQNGNTIDADATSLRMEKYQYRLKEIHKEAENNINRITIDNYINVIPQILLEQYQALENQKEGLKLFEKGIEIFDHYLFEEDLTKSLELIQKAADLGVSEAQQWMMNYKSEKEDGNAQYQLSIAYRDGINGHEKDKKLAQEWLIRAVRNGSPEACCDYAMQIYYLKPKEEEAYKLFNMAAEKGYLYGLAGMAALHLIWHEYDNAETLCKFILNNPMNEKNAFAIYEAKAIQLAMKQQDYKGLPKDKVTQYYESALDLLEDLIDKDSGNALCRCFIAAKSNPNIKTLEELNIHTIGANMKYPIISTEAFRFAIRSYQACMWHEEAKLNNKEAYYELHRYYYYRKMYKEAYYWGQLALDAGNKEAIYRAANYPEEFGINIDAEEASEMIMEAASMGQYQAETELYLRQQNIKTALKRYEGTLENSNMSKTAKKDALENIERNISYNLNGKSHTLEEMLSNDEIDYEDYAKIKNIKTKE